MNPKFISKQSSKVTLRNSGGGDCATARIGRHRWPTDQHIYYCQPCRPLALTGGEEVTAVISPPSSNPGVMEYSSSGHAHWTESHSLASDSPLPPFQDARQQHAIAPLPPTRAHSTVSLSTTVAAMSHLEYHCEDLPTIAVSSIPHVIKKTAKKQKGYDAVRMRDQEPQPPMQQQDTDTKRAVERVIQEVGQRLDEVRLACDRENHRQISVQNDINKTRAAIAELTDTIDKARRREVELNRHVSAWLETLNRGKDRLLTSGCRLAESNLLSKQLVENIGRLSDLLEIKRINVRQIIEETNESKIYHKAAIRSLRVEIVTLQQQLKAWNDRGAINATAMSRLEAKKTAAQEMLGKREREIADEQTKVSDLEAQLDILTQAVQRGRGEGETAEQSISVTSVVTTSSSVVQVNETDTAVLAEQLATRIIRQRMSGSG